MLLISCDFRDKYEYEVETQLISGEKISVKYYSKISKPIIDVRHFISIGGDALPKIKLMVLGKENIKPWVGKCIPIIVEKTSQALYLVSLCRKNTNLPDLFKFYKYNDNKWKQIYKKDFPKHLAIQNLWSYDGTTPRFAKDTPNSIVEGIENGITKFKRNPTKIKLDSWHFYRGLTARLWLYLEYDIPYQNSGHSGILDDKEAQSKAESYYNKYIKGYLKQKDKNSR
jgi:hypothetical protein